MNVMKVKAAVRARDGHKCVQCGMTNHQHRQRYGSSLHVHRISPGSEYTLEGCETLCYRCHGPKPKWVWGTPRVDPRLVFHLSPELLDALTEHIEATRPKPGLSSVLRVAVEDYLRARGLWPPPAKS